MLGRIDLDELKEKEKAFYTEERSDGIANLKKFRSSKERILFIGKEPWDNQGRYTNQKDTLNFFCSNRKEIHSPAMIRANNLASCILNSPNSKKAPVLDEVAWINVKKSPNTRNSY